MDPSPFREYDSVDGHDNSWILLGVVVVVAPKRYIRTFRGMVHGLSSLISLLLGNILFIKHVIMRLEREVSDSTNLAFWGFTCLSSSTTILFFWNKVQSWQLSTTTMREKGLTPKQLQNLNRGRGTLVPLSYSLLPALTCVVPRSFLKSEIFSIAVAVATIALSAGSYRLIREYGKALFMVYGLYPALASLAVLRHHQLSAVLDHYPCLVDHMEHQAYFVVSCIQMGFLLYYLYSRRLITKESAQQICKHYHPTLMFSYLACDVWQYGSGRSILPWPMVVHSVLFRLAGIVYAVRIGKTMVESIAQAAQGTSERESSTPRSDDVPQTRPPSERRRRSSASFLEWPEASLDRHMASASVKEE
jgi:hypothetical protein